MTILYSGKGCMYPGELLSGSGVIDSVPGLTLSSCQEACLGHPSCSLAEFYTPADRDLSGECMLYTGTVQDPTSVWQAGVFTLAAICAQGTV